MSHLKHFYGTECPHCERMVPIIAQLEKENGLTVEHLEVWHNEENAKLLTSYDSDGACGGVPFFINTQTGKTICGEATLEELKDWAS